MTYVSIYVDAVLHKTSFLSYSGVIMMMRDKYSTRVVYNDAYGWFLVVESPDCYAFYFSRLYAWVI